MPTIDNLSIEITASARRAAAEIDRLASSAGGVRTAAEKAGGGLRNLAGGAKDAAMASKDVSKETGSAARSTKGFGRTAEEAGKSAKRGSAGIATFWQALKRVAYYRFIRSIIKSITQAFKEGVTNLYKWSSAVNGHFAKSMDGLATSVQYLKNGLGTLAAPLLEAVAPALNTIIDLLVTAINYFNMFIAAISGRGTYTAAKKAATSWGDATKKSAKGASDAAKELKRTILGFDEINKLDKISDAGGGGSAGGGGGNFSDMFEERELSGGMQQFSNAIELAMQDTLSRITMIVGASELAVGALLALSGANVPLGLGLMASGAVTLGSAIFANWGGEISKEIKLTVAGIEAALAGGLAVGAILAFSGGNIPLGIGLMIGALSTGLGSVNIAWNAVGDLVKEKARAIATLVGGAALGVGTVLTFAGHPEVGIPLMLGGLSVGAVAINWDFIAEKLQGPIGRALALASSASLMLGILALLAGAVPLGLGLILLGTAGLAGTVAANWDNLKNIGKTAIEKVKSGWETIKSLAVTAWVALKEKVTEWSTNAWAVIKDKTKTWTQTVRAGIAKGAAWFENGWTIIKDKTHTWTQNVKAGIAKGATWFENGWNIIKDKTHTWTQNVKAGIAKGASWFENGWNVIKDKTHTWTQNVKAGIAKGASWFKDGWNAIKDKTKTWTQTVKAGIAKGKSWFKDGWTAIKDKTKTWTQTVKAGIAKGSSWFENGWNVIKDKTKTWTQNVAAGVTKGVSWFAEGWNAIKDKTKTWTQNVAAGVIQGTSWFENGWNVIKDKTKTWTQNVAASVIKGSSWFENGWTAIQSAGKDLSATVKASLAKGAEWVSDAWTIITQPNTIEKAVNIGLELAKNAINNLWNKIQQAWSEFISGKWLSINVKFEPPEGGNYDEETGVWQGDSWITSGKAAVDFFGQSIEIPAKIYPLWSLGEDLAVWIYDNFMGGNVLKEIGLTQSPAFKLAGTVLGYIFRNWWGGIIEKIVDLKRGGKFKEGGTVLGTIFQNWWGGDLQKAVDLIRGGKLKEGGTVLGAIFKNWWGGNIEKPVGLISNFGKTIFDWLKPKMGPDSQAPVSLAPKWDIQHPKPVLHLTNNDLASDALVNLVKGWHGTALSALDLKNLTAEIKAKLVMDSHADEVKVTFSNKDMTYRAVAKALGGAFFGGLWHSIPQYARGTLNAGSLFWAGEAGPELVGHAGGRTEVLNKSQIASAMYSAVRAAMAPASANFAAAAQSMSSASDSGIDEGTLMMMIQHAVEGAMTRSNDYDRQKVELLRQINEKEFTSEVSTADVIRGLDRRNRRAGTTVVPVG